MEKIIDVTLDRAPDPIGEYAAIEVEVEGKTLPIAVRKPTRRDAKAVAKIDEPEQLIAYLLVRFGEKDAIADPAQPLPLVTAEELRDPIYDDAIADIEAAIEVFRREPTAFVRAGDESSAIATMGTEIEYEVLPDKQIRLRDVPYGESKTDITLRPLTRRDRKLYESLKDAPNSEERMLQALIVEPRFTLVDLTAPSADLLMEVCGDAVNEFFRVDRRTVRHSRH